MKYEIRKIQNELYSDAFTMVYLMSIQLSRHSSGGARYSSIQPTLRVLYFPFREQPPGRTLFAIKKLCVLTFTSFTDLCVVLLTFVRTL